MARSRFLTTQSATVRTSIGERLSFVIASVVIFPLSQFLINLWPKNFAYTVDFNILLFLSTAVGALIIAFITAGYHCLKVASANPIQSIKV